MNLPTLIMKIQALRGHPLPVSSIPAPSDDPRSTAIESSDREQIRAAKGVTTIRGVEFARHAHARSNGSDLVLRMDIMLPKTGTDHPLVVYVPGGGFVVAPKIGGARMRRHVAAAGFVVASVEYRTTSNAATYEDGMADVRAAIAFLRQHASEYGIDGSRVALWGESAGGYLASMVGVTDGETEPGAKPGERILAVVNKFGGSSLERLAEGFDENTVAATDAPGNAPARYVHGPAAISITEDAARLRAADPTTHASAASPPFLIFHGTDDRLISPIQTAVLHHALLDVGADSTRYLVIGAGHGDIAVKAGEDKLWTTVPMMKLIIDFLRRTLVTPGSTSTD